MIKIIGSQKQLNFISFAHAATKKAADLLIKMSSPPVHSLSIQPPHISLIKVDTGGGAVGRQQSNFFHVLLSPAYGGGGGGIHGYFKLFKVFMRRLTIKEKRGSDINVCGFTRSLNMSPCKHLKGREQ